MQLNHFNWNATVEGETQKGRIAVLIENSEFKLQVVFGNAPPVEIIPHLFSELPEISEVGNRLNAGRVNPFAVDIYQGMSGCMDYRLIECRDIELKIFPVRSRLHVSMYGKLNENLNMWPGDFVIIADAISYNEKIMGSIWLDSAFIEEPKEWKQPNEAIVPDQVGIKIVKIGCQEVEIHEKFLKWNGLEFWPGISHELLKEKFPNEIGRFNEGMNLLGWYAANEWVLSRDATAQEMKKTKRTIENGPMVEIIKRPKV